MHHVVGDGALIGRVMSECFKGITIKTVKAVLSAKPQKAAPILHAAVNGIMR
jgi:hypothetical protein